MPRNHRRKRPGHRPPNGCSSRVRSAPPHYRSGFTGLGFDALYRSILPGLAGREKRQLFNRLALAIVAGSGLAGTAVGLEHGPFWAAIGGTAGLAAGMRYVTSARFLR
jgi:hypothetical protein